MLSDGQAWLFGCSGVVLAWVASVYPYHRLPKDQWPKWLGYGSYWIFTIIMVPIGGYLAWLTISEREVSRFLAVYIGAAAPLILERLAGSIPDIGVGQAT